MKKPKQTLNFYKSEAWQQTREIKIVNQNGKYERCVKLGNEIHHKKHINFNNYQDTSISLAQSNLELSYRECYNKEHTRFSKLKSQKFDDERNLIV